MINVPISFAATNLRKIVSITTGTLMILLVACGGNPAPGTPVSDWQYDGSTYQVVSGISADVPASWVERGWSGDGVVVYLADQEITCDDFPTDVTREFPPRPVLNGATIRLHITEKENSPNLQRGSFDIVNRNVQGGHSSGLSTDVTAGITAVEGGRVHGWLEHIKPRTGTAQVNVSGSFNVPFCS